MDNKNVIEAYHASKKFCKSLKQTIKYGFIDVGKSIFGLESGSDKLREKEFWALDDVSFKVEKGEALGVIGANGSGKSTLFKLLNGIFMPDRGRIKIRGRVGALIGVGAGFHPMLTGKENIYINGVILGMSQKEIDRKFESIVEFADIGDFLDTPVKNYSSGMLVRLGFALAIFCEPDILLVDEVLAVGDQKFQEKCLKKLKDIAVSETTLLFVSHDMTAIRQLCHKTMILSCGRVRDLLPSEKAIEKYLACNNKN